MERQKDMLEQAIEEKGLMREWEQHWHEQHSSYSRFNQDGIVNYERWAELPGGRHILVILKETNALKGSLTDFLDNGGNDTYYHTWNNVARWVRMIMDGVYLEHIDRSTLDLSVKEIAVMNLKKYAGGTRANAREVKEVALRDLPLLKRQVQLYEPDIILTGGWRLVSDFLHDYILEETCPWYDPRKRENLESDPDLWYFWTNKVRAEKPTLVISMPHPNRAAKKWTLELQKILAREKIDLNIR